MKKSPQILFLKVLSFLLISYSSNAQWSEVAPASLNAKGDILTLETDYQGNLYAGGEFKNSAGYYYVAKWDGTSWSELGTGANALNADSKIRKIVVDKNNNLYVSGDFFVGGYTYLAKWDGTSWSHVSTGSNHFQSITAMAVNAANNKLYMLCNADFSAFSTIPEILEYDGTNFNVLTNGQAFNWASGDYGDIVVDSNTNNIYIAVDSPSKSDVFKYTGGQTWARLGNGIAPLGAGGNLNSIVVDKTGNVYTSGGYWISSYILVCKWNGSTWSKAGGTTIPDFDNGRVLYDMTLDKNSKLFVCGDMQSLSSHKGYVPTITSGSWADTGGDDKSASYAICTDKVSNSIYVGGNKQDGSSRRIVNKLSNPTSINDVNQSNQFFNLSPNPIRDYFNVSEIITGIRIINIMGQEVYKMDHLKSTRIDISNLQSGTYMVIGFDSQNRYNTQTIIKE